MATNHYFNHFNNPSEQSLYDDLAIEAIKIYGQDVYYIPRELVKEDKLFGEDTLSRFRQYFVIEMYLESVDGFSGNGDFLSKFGLQVRDSGKLVVSKHRFKTATEKDRPLEGDLIYFPLSKGLFEIKYVEHEHIFYELGKNATFQLSIELFQYSQEEIDTNYDEIDAIIAPRIYSKFLTYGGTADAFDVGERVYSYTNGSLTGGLSGADSYATISKIAGSSTITIQDMVGPWKSTTGGVTRYVTNEASSTYRPISTITDTIDSDSYDNNKNIQTEGNTILDFSENNPFSENGRY